MMDKLLAQLSLPSPLHEINHPLLAPSGISLSIKRDDLIHPLISGNKWRKLKYHLKHAINNDVKTIITFGGPFSNHIYATSSACHLMGIPSIGLIRGELDLNNPTLRHCASHGMELIGIPREEYRLGMESAIIQTLIDSEPSVYVIPEGGMEYAGMRGVQEIWHELLDQCEATPDYIVVACGTGCTTAGLAWASGVDTTILSMPVAADPSIPHKVEAILEHKDHLPIRYETGYTYGGYGRYDEDLLARIKTLEQEIDVPLDPIYTGKAMLGLFDLIQKGKFNQGASVLFLHTGGLQGNLGVAYRKSKK
jgi:1-aminocyclopropane-1-carboxylate deaminase